MPTIYNQKYLTLPQQVAKNKKDIQEIKEEIETPITHYVMLEIDEIITDVIESSGSTILIKDDLDLNNKKITNVNLPDYVKSTELVSVMKYKGSVATYEILVAINNPKLGDVYNVISDDKNYAWNGSTWDELGGLVDLSGYQPLLQAGDNITIIGNTISASAPTYSLPLASNNRGGIKASFKDLNDTVEVKIDTTSEKLYVPTYPTIPTIPTISNDIILDKTSTTKTASPKAVYEYVTDILGDLASLLALI